MEVCAAADGLGRCGGSPVDVLAGCGSPCGLPAAQSGRASGARDGRPLLGSFAPRPPAVGRSPAGAAGGGSCFGAAGAAHVDPDLHRDSQRQSDADHDPPRGSGLGPQLVPGSFEVARVSCGATGVSIAAGTSLSASGAGGAPESDALSRQPRRQPPSAGLEGGVRPGAGRRGAAVGQHSSQG